MESSSSSAVLASLGSRVVAGGEAEAAEEMTLSVKWSGKEYTMRVCADDSMAELKRRICEATTVLPKRQKLLYPKLSAKLGDDSLLSTLDLKPSVKITMIGTVEDEIIVDQVDSPEIVDDFELGQDEVLNIKDKDVNKQKLRRQINHYKIKPRNPCREGRKLLVLMDIDYTLFDHRSPAENPFELMRPYLHGFLSAVYAEYDIIIWSATSMKWVKLKMAQLGVLDNPNYKTTALLDRLAMITVQSDSRGTFDCKPLGLIWALFPEVCG